MYVSLSVCVYVYFASTQMWKEQNITLLIFHKYTSGNLKLSKECNSLWGEYSVSHSSHLLSRLLILSHVFRHSLPHVDPHSR